MCAREVTAAALLLAEVVAHFKLNAANMVGEEDASGHSGHEDQQQREHLQVAGEHTAELRIQQVLSSECTLHYHLVRAPVPHTINEGADEDAEPRVRLIVERPENVQRERVRLSAFAVHLDSLSRVSSQAGIDDPVTQQVLRRMHRLVQDLANQSSVRHSTCIQAEYGRRTPNFYDRYMARILNIIVTLYAQFFQNQKRILKVWM